MKLTGTNRPRTCHKLRRLRLAATRPLCGSRGAVPAAALTELRRGGAGQTSQESFGDHSERETPGPIPNPEAKPLSADGTARATAWESRTSPDTTSDEGRPVFRTALVG